MASSMFTCTTRSAASSGLLSQKFYLSWFEIHLARPTEPSRTLDCWLKVQLPNKHGQLSIKADQGYPQSNRPIRGTQQWIDTPFDKFAKGKGAELNLLASAKPRSHSNNARSRLMQTTHNLQVYRYQLSPLPVITAALLQQIRPLR